MPLKYCLVQELGMFSCCAIDLCLFILLLPPRETVLVTAGAGATGLAIIDLAANVFQAKVSRYLPFHQSLSFCVRAPVPHLDKQVAWHSGGRGRESRPGLCWV